MREYCVGCIRNHSNASRSTHHCHSCPRRGPGTGRHTLRLSCHTLPKAQGNPGWCSMRQQRCKRWIFLRLGRCHTKQCCTSGQCGCHRTCSCWQCIQQYHPNCTLRHRSSGNWGAGQGRLYCSCYQHTGLTAVRMAALHSSWTRCSTLCWHRRRCPC